jgi:hypothetical protein
MEPKREAAMLNLLLDHTPAFLVGELVLAASLGTFGVAFLGALRERYSERSPVRVRGLRDRSGR